MEIDHSNVWDDPFGRKKDGLRLIDRIATNSCFVSLDKLGKLLDRFGSAKIN